MFTHIMMVIISVTWFMELIYTFIFVFRVYLKTEHLSKEEEDSYLFQFTAFYFVSLICSIALFWSLGPKIEFFKYFMVDLLAAIIISVISISLFHIAPFLYLTNKSDKSE
jgi:hypothetical protein